MQIVVAVKVVPYVCSLSYVYLLSSNVIVLYLMFPICQVFVFGDFSDDKTVLGRLRTCFFTSSSYRKKIGLIASVLVDEHHFGKLQLYI